MPPAIHWAYYLASGAGPAAAIPASSNPHSRASVLICSGCMDTELPPVLFRYPTRPQVPPQEDMLGFARGQLAPVRREAHFVGEQHHARVGLFHPRADDDFLVEPRRRGVAAARLGYRQENAILQLHLLVLEAARFAVLHAADLHPHQVIGVVNHAHLVGFGIAHADARFVRRHCEQLYAQARPRVGRWQMVSYSWRRAAMGSMREARRAGA